MGFGFGRLSASPSGLSADDFLSILAAAQPGAPAEPPRRPFGFGPLAPSTGAPMAMPPVSGGNLSAAASMFGGQPDPRADMADAAPVLGRSPLDFGPTGGASLDDRFNQAPAGQGFGVDPGKVAAMRSGLLRQAPGEVVPLPAQADVPETGAIPIAGQAPPDVAPRVPRPLSFGALPSGSPAQAGPIAPALPPAAAPEQPAEGGGFLSSLGNPAVYDTLLGIGQGLLTNKGFGPGIAAGTALASRMGREQASADLAGAELGLKRQKLAQEVVGQNQTIELLTRAGHSPEAARAMVLAAGAGNREALSNALNNLLPKSAETPFGWVKRPDGTLVPAPGGPQDSATLRSHAQAQAEGAAAGKPDDPFNLSPGQTRFDASGNPLVSVPDRSKMLEQSSSIRKEIHGLPSYKNYTQALPVYQGMLETADRDSKASDLNLIYGLGKIMDPGSVVREGELRLAQDTQGVADKLIGMYNSVSGGARLSPTARQQLLAEAYGRIQSYESAFGQDRRGYEGIVARQGMNADDVLPNFAPAKPYQPPQRARPQQTDGAPDGAVRALRSDPSLRDQFDAKYGRGSAERYLGGR